MIIMLKNFVFKSVALFVGIMTVFFGVTKIMIMFCVNSDTQMLVRVLLLCGALYAYLGMRYLLVVQKKAYKKSEICGIAVLFFIGGLLCTYFPANLIAMGIWTVFMYIFQIGNQDQMNQDFILVIGFTSIFLALSAYAACTYRIRKTRK